MPRYKVTLSESERNELEKLTRAHNTKAIKFIHARVLLLCDASCGKPPMTVAEIAKTLNISSRTIEHIKQRFVENGLEAALDRKKRETPPSELFDGEFDARLIALACSDPPEGHARWTVRLLADKVVELELVPSISHMTVHKILKKTNFNLTEANTGKSLPRKIQLS